VGMNILKGSSELARGLNERLESVLLSVEGGDGGSGVFDDGL